MILTCEFLQSHRGVAEDLGLVGCDDAVLSGEWLATFGEKCTRLHEATNPRQMQGSCRIKHYVLSKRLKSLTQRHSVTYRMT